MRFSNSAIASIFLTMMIPTASNAWVVLSRQSSSVIFKAVWDVRSFKIVTSGVEYRDEYTDVTLQAQHDTDCLMSVGDARGFDRSVFETPQMCLDVSLFDDIPEGGYAPGVPQGIVTGMTGSQATVLSLDYYGDYDELKIRDSVNLPYGTFPVDLKTDPQGGVYVGLHSTEGLMVPAADPNKSKVDTIYGYVSLMKDPVASVVTSPQVIKINVTNGDVLWETTLSTEEGRSTIGGMEYIASRNVVAVAGSSNGKGSLVGAGVSSTDWDGYLTLMDATTGIADDTNANLTHLSADHSIRIQSQPNQDDFVLATCSSDDKMYVVGSTTGIIDGTEAGGAFVIKYDVDTLNILWKRQIVGMGVEATTCVANADLVYLGGLVPAGILLDDETRTDGPSDTQDVFAAAIHGDSGEFFWIRQIDSRQEDILPNLMISQIKNLMFSANALNPEDGSTVIYLMSIFLETGFHDWIALPKDANPLAGAQNAGEGITVPPVGTVGAEEGGNNDNNDNEEDKDNTTVIVVAVVVPVVLLLMVVAYSILTKKSEKEPMMGSRHEEASPLEENNPQVAKTQAGNDRTVV